MDTAENKYYIHGVLPATWYHLGQAMAKMAATLGNCKAWVGSILKIGGRPCTKVVWPGMASFPWLDVRTSILCTGTVS